MTRAMAKQPLHEDMEVKSIEMDPSIALSCRMLRSVHSDTQAKRSNALSFIGRTILCLLSLARVAVVKAQVDGVCVCSPTVYQWSLDFGATCPPNNIQQGPQQGISDSVCLIFAEDNSVTDLVPVRTTTLQFFELNRNLEAINAVFRDGLDLADGDTFSYTSVIAAEPNPVPDRIPGGFQMRVTSENANGDALINDWIVAFTNSCEVVPFQGNGEDSLGWAVFDELVPARPELCPLVTLAPTGAPVPDPTPAPAVDPAPAPVRPTPVATPRPTSSPEEEPSQPSRPPRPSAPSPTRPTAPSPTRPTAPSPTRPTAPTPTRPTAPTPTRPTAPTPTRPTRPTAPEPTPISMSYDYSDEDSDKPWWIYRTPEKGGKGSKGSSKSKSSKSSKGSSKSSSKMKGKGKKTKHNRGHKKYKADTKQHHEKQQNWWSSTATKPQRQKVQRKWERSNNKSKREKVDYSGSHWKHVWKWHWAWHHNQ